MPRSHDHYLQLHLPALKFDDNRQLWLLYFNRVTRWLVNKLCFFFFPVYLFLIGQKLLGAFLPNQIVAGILMICIYYLLNRTAIVLLMLPFGKYISTIGHQRAILIGYSLRSVFFLSLLISTLNPIFILSAAIFDAIQYSFFWPSYHTVLSKHTHKNKMGADLGILNFMFQLTAVISPAVAGIISVKYGYDILFMLGFLGTLVGLAMVLPMKPSVDRDRISWAELSSWMKERTFQKLSLAFGGRYFNDAALFLWPLYVFFILGSMDKVGFLYTLSLFMAMVLTIFLTFKLDKMKSRRNFKFSGGLLALVWLARTQIYTVWGIAIADMLEKLTSNFHWLYYDMTSYRRSKGSQAHSYFVYYEIMQSLSGIAFWLSVAALALLSQSWLGIFVLGAVGVVFSTLMNRQFDRKNHQLRAVRL